MARSNSLARYREKRDFHKTPEPAGKKATAAGKHYLIQKHAATRLHYDFRLELDGVLKSWAVTRGPSLDPHDRRLAVEVEDHPVAYGSFEGIIPKGQYGGGTVMLWDEGTWEPIGDAYKQLQKGHLHFRLKGKRLHGEWVLVRMKSREKDRGRNNWLLIKHGDKDARPGDHDQLLEKNKRSVVSKRTMEEIAKAQDKVWQSKEAKTKSQSEKASLLKNKKSKSKPLPGFIQPQLATLTSSVPEGKNWVHEIKFDGYRMLAYIQDGKVRMLSRNNKDWTEKFGPIVKMLATLPVDNAILDGEVVAVDDAGVSSFKLLKDSLGDGKSHPMQYYVFDLLHLNGENLMPLSLLERKQRLQTILAKKRSSIVLYSEHFTDQHHDFFLRACKLHLEGVISKRSDAPYRTGRGKEWLKSKCHRRQEFVIGGYTLPEKGGAAIGALLLGYYEGSKLVYAGKVGTGLTHDESHQLYKRLKATEQKASPYVSVPADGRRGAHWVEPKLVCEVEFFEWTDDGRLRHPSFQGMREDKPARDVKRDHAISPKAVMEKSTATSPTTMTKTSVKNAATVAGINITHPDRVIFSDLGVTKLQLAEYYHAVADHLLPHIKNRPLSMVRCPEGSDEPCFFQRHIARGQSAYLHEIDVPVKGKKETYLMIRDLKGLISLVQWGVIELHPWGCLADDPLRPDRIIFDLDPDPAVKWERMVKGAQEIRTRMQEFGLESFIKTTGGKGLHVVVPLARSYGWPAIKGFARAVADSMAHDTPDLYIATMSKAKRKGKIFVDYLRNDITATAIAPFAVRARKGAPVATPIAWKELTASLKPSDFTLETVPARLAAKKDPWSDFFKTRQKIPAKILRALKIEPE